MAQRQQWSRLPGVGTITRPQATLRQLWVPFPSLLRSATTDNHTQTGQEMPCTTGLEDSLPKGSQAQLYLFHSIRSHLVVLEELQGWKKWHKHDGRNFFKAWFLISSKHLVCRNKCFFPCVNQPTGNQKFNSDALLSLDPTQSVVMATFMAKDLGSKLMLHEQFSLDRIMCHGAPSCLICHLSCFSNYCEHGCNDICVGTLFFLVCHTSLAIVETVGQLFCRTSSLPLAWPSPPSTGAVVGQASGFS